MSKAVKILQRTKSRKIKEKLRHEDSSTKQIREDKNLAQKCALSATTTTTATE